MWVNPILNIIGVNSLMLESSQLNIYIPKLSLASDGVREWGGEGIGRPYICCLSAIVIFRLLVGDIDPCLSWAETILCCKPLDSFADRDPKVKNYIIYNLYRQLKDWK